LKIFCAYDGGIANLLVVVEFVEVDLSVTGTRIRQRIIAERVPSLSCMAKRL
jgi:hypothetical protein